jgi:hypothetical protein
MEIVSNETSTGTIELIFRALSSGSGGSVDVRENMFISLTSGNSVNTTVSVAGNIYWVYRNGIQQLEGIDYTRSGQTFTFTTNFGILSGGIGSETVYIIYFH